MYKKGNKNNRGFSLAEVIVAVAVFTVISTAMYSGYQSILYVVSLNRSKIDAVDLVNEELEIIRNLPYSDVGIQSGLPAGKIPHIQTIVRDTNVFVVTTTIRNVDDPFDGTLGGTPNDLSPADFKIAEIQIDCTNCRNFAPVIVTTRVAPKNLETASTNGALFIKVFDASGNPIPDVNVHVANTTITPQIVIDDVTNNSGVLQIVDAPPGANAYDITVSKTGYSGEQTTESTVDNPNPLIPPATVALQQVTQISFIIDRVSTLNLSSVTQTCSPVPSVSLNVKGTKLLGQSPDVLKYNNNFTTNGSGALSLNNLQWDSYAVNLTDAVYELIGINPIPPINLTPGATLNAKLIVLAKNPNTVLVSVKDNATGLPLSGVSVIISKTGFTSVEKYTGQGFLMQTDWSGGAGQASSTDLTMFATTDDNLDFVATPGDIKLKKILGDYVASGILESSSFDTGSVSNFDKILWNPLSQPLDTGAPNVRFQIATNNDGGIWDYFGPDGTSGTYYTSADQNISSVNDSNRYLRYKMFLDSASTSTTPSLSDVSFTFTSDCTPSGQVYFNGLPSGTYDLHLTKSGYADIDVTVDASAPWQLKEILMIPN